MFTDIIDKLTLEMIKFNQHDPMRIQHLLKVHSFAKLIGHGENLDEHTQFITECVALVHDIGIRVAEEKYGKCNGKLQEQEGPAPARTMLTALGLAEADIERICYLIAHHHTYTNIDGIDYQILVEADFLVNFFEEEIALAGIQGAYNKVFKTQTGKTLCELSYFKDAQA